MSTPNYPHRLGGIATIREHPDGSRTYFFTRNGEWVAWRVIDRHRTEAYGRTEAQALEQLAAKLASQGRA